MDLSRQECSRAPNPDGRNGLADTTSIVLEITPPSAVGRPASRATIIEPVVDRTFPLEAAAEAISYAQAGRAVGKVVIRVAD